MDIETVFGKVMGRAATGPEKARLQRVQRLWNVRGNEALLALVLVFHLGEARSPDARAPEGARSLPRPGSAALPSRMNFGPVTARTLAVLAATLWIVALGLLGMSLGASGQWRRPQQPNGLLPDALLAVLMARAGWTVLVAMSTPALYGALWGWTRARAQQSDRRTRATGCVVFLAVNGAMLGWLALLLFV